MRKISHRSSNQSVGSITRQTVQSIEKASTKKQSTLIKMSKNMEKENKRKAAVNSAMLILIKFVQ
jgi:hypothetical protein